MHFVVFALFESIFFVSLTPNSINYTLLLIIKKDEKATIYVVYDALWHQHWICPEAER